jgi:ABC-type sugar transport system substrate-binding protein
VLQRDTDAAGQLEDVRRLIADGVDAIVVHPSSTKALDPALEEAAEAGIVVVSVDGSVTAPAAFR